MVLRKTLQSIPEKVLPSHESEKSLADHSVSFFSDKIFKNQPFQNSGDFCMVTLKVSSWVPYCSPCILHLPVKSFVRTHL